MNIKKIKRGYIFRFILFFTLVFVNIFIFNLMVLDNFNIGLPTQVIVSIVLFSICFYFSSIHYINKYNTYLQDNHIKDLIEKSLITDDCEYEEEKHIKKSKIVNSGLILKNVFVNGEDYFHYNYKNTKIEVSDVFFNSMDDGKCLEKGIFVYFKMSKKQKNNLLVTNKTIQDKYSRLDTTDWNDLKLKKINIQNIELDKRYNIHTDSYKWSNKILENIIYPLLSKNIDKHVIEISIHKDNFCIFINNELLKFDNKSTFKPKKINSLENNVTDSVALIKNLVETFDSN
jgi:hypothetical protein